MVTAGAFQLAGKHAPELAIEHVREPGDGVPVGGVAQMKCPPKIFPGQTAANVVVVDDVIRVINVGQFEMSRLPINSESDSREREAHDKNSPSGCL